MSVKRKPGKKAPKRKVDAKVDLRFVCIARCIEIGSISESTFMRLVASGVMPQPIKIGRANRWIEQDVIAAYKRLARGGA